MTRPLEKPKKPEDDDCCGGGACCPCVWDHYYAERLAWKKQHQEPDTSKQHKQTLIKGD